MSITLPQGLLILAPARASREVESELVLMQPFQPLYHRRPGAGASLLFVLGRIEMIDRNAKGELPGKLSLQIQQSRLDTWTHHRSHGVCEHQYRVACVKGQAQNRQNIRVHKGLAAGKTNFCGAQPLYLDLVKIARYIIER